MTSATCECNTNYHEDTDLKACVANTGSSSVGFIAIGGAVCSGGAVFLGMILHEKRKQKKEN